MKPEISVVIPVLNEAGNIAPLHGELVDTLTAIGRPYELIYVNDGSTDGTAAELAGLSGATVIEMARRFGKATAFMAAFENAAASIIVTIDGDGQNDPRDIPKLLEEMKERDLDAVAGWRVHRKDRTAIRFITQTGRKLREKLLDDGVSDSGCALRVYKKEAVDSLDLQGEMDRYIPALLVWKGFRVGQLPINDRPRLHGSSKYKVNKAVRAFIDLWYLWFLHKYSQRPLHLFGYMGLTSLALGAVSAGITIYDRLIAGIHLNRDGWFFLTFFFLIAAIMLVSFGLMLDLLMRIYHNTSSREKRYYIRNITTTA
jgi:glycosyltransferase involved in cell wall biosynthesis